MKRRLQGKRAVITGASSGIGRATALRMAAEGADLALLARNLERLEAVAAEAQALGARAVVIPCDTMDRAQVQAAMDAAAAQLSGVDILHCNAGVYYRRPAADLELSQIRRVMEVNFYGYLNCVYAVLPRFLAQRDGVIVATCSMDSKKGVPPDAAYAASKFAINGFFQVLRQELRGSGVHVATVFPSRTDTPQIAHVDCPATSAKCSPELVAKAVVRAVARREKEVVVPAYAKMLQWADTISPSLSDWLVRVLHAAGTENGRPAINEVDGAPGQRAE